MPQLQLIEGFPKITVDGEKAHFHGTKDALYARWEKADDKHVHLKFTVGYNSGANKVTANYRQCVLRGKEGSETKGALVGEAALVAAKDRFAIAIEEKIKTDFVK